MRTAKIKDYNFLTSKIENFDKIIRYWRRKKEEIVQKYPEYTILFERNQTEFMRLYFRYKYDRSKKEEWNVLHNIIVYNSLFYFLKQVNATKNGQEKLFTLKKVLSDFYIKLDEGLKKYEILYNAGKVSGKKGFTAFIGFYLMNSIRLQDMQRDLIRTSYTVINGADVPERLNKIEEILDSYLVKEDDEKLYYYFIYRYIFEIQSNDAIKNKMKKYNNLEVSDSELKILHKKAIYIIDKILDVDLLNMRRIAKQTSYQYISTDSIVSYHNKKEERNAKTVGDTLSNDDLNDLLIEDKIKTYDIYTIKKLMLKYFKMKIKKYPRQLDIFGNVTYDDKIQEYQLTIKLLDKLIDELNQNNDIKNAIKSVKQYVNDDYLYKSVIANIQKAYNYAKEYIS